MRKIFLDIGGYDGISAEFFRENHPEGWEFEIYTFECDKRNLQILRNYKSLKINLIEKAAWIYDGTVKYYYGLSDAGTLYSSKKTGGINPDNFYEVECVDFVNFIKSNFAKDDYIIIKMNCEGAEYELIPHLQEHGLIGWIDKWYIQWHADRINLPDGTHERVAGMIPEWNEWNCQLRNPAFIEIFKKSL